MNERDVKLFKLLHNSQLGADLVAFLEDEVKRVTDIALVTSENLSAKKETAQALRGIIEKIKLINDEKKADNNPYV